MTLSDISIKRPVFAWMLMAGLLVFGALSFFYIGISQLPDVDFPVVTVRITWAGASPDIMETAVADPVENAVMGIDGAQLVQSVSQQGQTQVTIQFSLDQDINVALQQVQTKVSQAQRNLPQTVDAPIITKTNPNDQPILYAAAYSNAGMSLRDISLYMRDHLQDRITTIKGVGDVNLGGYMDPQMRIWLDREKMNRLEITVQDIIAAINSQHRLVASGYQDVGNIERLVHINSEFRNADECNALVIPSRTGAPIWRPIHIRDVAECKEGVDEVRRISRYNGIAPTVSIGVIKQHGTNAVAIGDKVRKRIEELKKELPPGVDLSIVTDVTSFIRDSVSDFFTTLGLAVIFTALVCYLFLGSFSSAFNVLFAIPISLIGSFIFFRLFNLTLNSFTLMALALAIGIVVDDAIMMQENISRHIEEGQERVLAAIVGAREITPAAVATSLAILAIFAPVVFMAGIVGKFFFEFGISM
ncbi:MAG: efflux RND transporter permease subunit, partial [Pseudobdellovibrio sp.]